MFILKRVSSVQPRRVSVEVLCERRQDTPQCQTVATKWATDKTLSSKSRWVD